ncbi:hypothetical protein ACFVWY_18650 [Streptomyces sp. NPDC058195]|uniref:hypothetical protein n=1 Tax=Streptomyces sp. NPDC058195 TaxID=3346375 RepID=UPI0036E63E73
MNPSGRFRRLAGGSFGERFVFLAPLVLTAVITVLALMTPRGYYFSRFLSLAPAFAAALWPVAATVAIGGLAAVINVAIAVSFGELSDSSGTYLFTLAVIAGSTAAAALASYVRQ